MYRILLLTVIATCVLPCSVIAAAPQLINYQGILTDSTGTTVADGSYSVVFTIYDAAVAGTSVWTETQNVNTTDGLFAVLLGTVNPVLNSVFNGTTRYLGVKVGVDSEIAPRSRLVTAPYAFQADVANNADLLDGNDATAFAGSVHTHSAYVNKSGDILTGDLLRANGGNSDAVRIGVFGVDAGRLWVEGTGGGVDFVAEGDVSGDGIFFNINAGTPGSNNFTVQNIGSGLLGVDINGANPSRFRPGISGSGSVVLPLDAISNFEIFDEPGIAQGKRVGAIFITNPNVFIDVATVTITIPATGYIVVEASGLVTVRGSEVVNYVRYQIVENQFELLDNSHYQLAGMWIPVGGGPIYFPASVRRTYFKLAGTYTFRIASNKSGGGTANWFNTTITATYYPTSYGAVSTVVSASEAGEFENATPIPVGKNPFGEDISQSEQSFLVDLRELELRAVRAEAKAAKAALDLERAQAAAQQSQAATGGLQGDQ